MQCTAPTSPLSSNNLEPKLSAKKTSVDAPTSQPPVNKKRTSEQHNPPPPEQPTLADPSSFVSKYLFAPL
eukprot:10460115-Ditylum_brightwellii.AAC.1